ncbi:hypothetical protein X777_09975 [Ooceraea biroi]|uniref:Uncharacterized protein n=1 Tax=Ooceraea biroi TaxID=2015173 RepID=A0A026W5E4_OOCBI|nr:hypothetical protein X777_09975 [Ooceraea biroi]
MRLKNVSGSPSAGAHHAHARTAFEVARNPHHDALLTKDLWFCAYALVKGAALGIIP